MVVKEHADVAYPDKPEVNRVCIKQQLSAVALYRTGLLRAHRAVLPVGKKARHDGVKLGLVDRFQQEVERPVAERRQHIVAVSGVYHHITPEVCLLLQPFEKLQPGHVRQLHVKEQQLRLVLYDLLYAVLAAVGGSSQRHVLILSELSGQVVNGRPRVVYNYRVHGFSVRFNAFQSRKPHTPGHGYSHLATLYTAVGSAQVPYSKAHLVLIISVYQADCAADYLQSRAG